MGPDRDHADAASTGPLEVHVYPGRDATFTLYEDVGDGYGYEAGEFTTVELAWDEGARRLTIAQRVGAYPGMLLERDILVVIHSGLDRKLSEPPVEPRWLRYAGERVEVQW
jgi:alpha-D-xyloside xylohydrolase